MVKDYDIVDGLNRHLGKKLLGFGRTEVKLVSGFLTGHNSLKKYFHLMDCWMICADKVVGRKWKNSFIIFASIMP